MRLKGVIHSIAEVIGRENALYLVGKLPRFTPKSRKCERVLLYVPMAKNLKPNHQLVDILGWHAAIKLCEAFGGEVIDPGVCSHVYQGFRDESIAKLVEEGVPTPMIAEWFAMTDRHVRRLASI